MAVIVLFHSVLGLRPAEQRIASAFEKEGHSVILPDLYGRPGVDDYDAAFALQQEVGEEVVRTRAQVALEAAPAGAVLAGVSFGAYLAALFFPMRPEMAGALLFAGLPPRVVSSRAGLRVSAHIARPDPFESEEDLASSADNSSGILLELHRYESVGHYFLDASLPGYDADIADRCLNLCYSFLNDLHLMNSQTGRMKGHKP